MADEESQVTDFLYQEARRLRRKRPQLFVGERVRQVELARLMGISGSAMTRFLSGESKLGKKFEAGLLQLFKTDSSGRDTSKGALWDEIMNSAPAPPNAFIANRSD